MLLAQLGAPDLARVPTRLPRHYAFESYSVTAHPLGLDVSFADQRFINDPTKTHEYEISFDTSYVSGSAPNCSANAKRTSRVAGTTVYIAGNTVWHCAETQRGKLLKDTANGRTSHTNLALIVLSVRPAH